MTQREAVLAMMRGEKVDTIVNGWEPFQLVFDEMLMRTGPGPEEVSKDIWGVTMIWEEGQPGRMPCEDPELLACPDITEWKSYLTKPDIINMEFDWTSALAQKEAAHAQDKLALAFMPIGVFELCHNLLGFEEALVNFLIEPECMKELVDCIFEYKMECIKRTIDGWHPDGILFHDDWGSRDSLLLPPDTWREYFKEGYRKLYDYAHEQGVFIMHHSDSNNELIAEDMEEIGVDIWQGALPQCDIAGLQNKLTGNMLFMGGFDSGVIDHDGLDPETIRQEVFRACDAYLSGGKYIPCITYGGPGSIYSYVDDIISEAVHSLNK